jgi:hypothetical protein
VSLSLRLQGGHQEAAVPPECRLGGVDGDDDFDFGDEMEVRGDHGVLYSFIVTVSDE